MKLINVKYMIILLGAVLCLNVYGQENSVMSKQEQKQLVKEQRHQERQAEAKKTAAIVDNLLKERKFVLEADYLSGKTGNRVPVSSNINFIIIDSSNCVLQVGNPQGVGYNGVGGITVEGPITKYSLKKIEKKKSTYYNLTMITTNSTGVYDISMNIDTSGNADATVRGITPGSLTYHGVINSLEASKVYKAQTYP